MNNNCSTPARVMLCMRLQKIQTENHQQPAGWFIQQNSIQKSVWLVYFICGIRDGQQQGSLPRSQPERSNVWSSVPAELFAIKDLFAKFHDAKHLPKTTLHPSHTVSPKQ